MLAEPLLNSCNISVGFVLHKLQGPTIVLWQLCIPTTMASLKDTGDCAT
jgi:hypothetical protein